ncbi:MAG: NAD(P)/FAD-dependent oxidoreductase, partial [Lachnospiraceae bacterium]
MKKIMIVGAGYSGILTAKKLEKKLRKKHKNSEYEITLIDKRPFHTMLTELHEVAAWRVEEDSIKIDLNQVFAGRKVNVVLDQVNSIDYEAKKIHGEAGDYDFDYMVLASGSKPTFFGVEGAKEHSFTLWSYEDAVILREHIVQKFRDAACCTDLETKKRMLNFYVVGAGFTGVEMAGELAELVPILCERFHIDRKMVTIVNIDAMDKVCAVLPDKLSSKVQKRLEKMGVEVRLKSQICGVGKNYITCKTNDKSEQFPADTVIWTAGIEGADIAASSKEIGDAGRGRIQTDEYLRSDKHKNVYIAGDNIFYVPEGEQRPVPQMVENAEASADTVAHNLVCELTGKGEMEKYAPKFHGVMVCVGGRYGVANVGLPNKMFALPSFLAMFTKHFINIIYFAQVLGWNKIFSYLKHEFFTIRNSRSFVGGHFSNRSPSFVLVPLRIFLGAIWIHEGVVKIGEGWLSSPKLEGFFHGANQFYQSILYPGSTTTDVASAASAVADVVSSASNAGADAVAQAGQLLGYLDILGWIKFIFVKGSEYAFKIEIPAMDWIINQFVLPLEGMQMVFQIVIVISEILIGLALIGGLFTTAAAGYSLILQAMFLTSTGL